MKRARAGLSIGVVACLLMLVGIFASSFSPSNAQSSCAGKTYPSPGCPNLRPPLTTQERALCGNEELNGKEECDDGPANGTNDSGCSATCKIRYCGDGTLQTYMGEECEPIAQEFYALSGTGLVIQRRYTGPQCGENYCLAPACDSAGNNCDGGCVIIPHGGACTASSNSAKSSSKSSKKTGTPGLISSGSSTSSVGSSNASSKNSSASVVSSVASSSSQAAVLPPPASSSEAKSSVVLTVSSAPKSSAAVSSKASEAAKPASSIASKSSSVAPPASSSSSVAPISSPPGIGLSISMDGPLVIQRGQKAAYRLIARNNTNAFIRNVVVSDYLINYGSQESFTLETNTGESGKCQLTGVSVRCSGFDLNPNESRVLMFSFQFLTQSQCETRQKADAYATITGDLEDTDLHDNETDLLSTIVLCNQPGPTPSSSSSSSRPTGPTRSSQSSRPVAPTRSSRSSANESASESSESMSAASSIEPVIVENASSSFSGSSVPSVCGDGIEDAGEECDFGLDNGTPTSVCDNACHRLLPGPPIDDQEATRVFALRISYGILAALVPAYLFVARRRWMKLFKDIDDDDLPDPNRKSIDDVPLDEIEMPWRKF